MFRYCPACNQSVLDEDATECPFCGASMSAAKGTPAKKAPSAAKTTAQTPESTAAKPVAQKADPAKPTAKKVRGPIGDLDPMSAAAAEAKTSKVIQALRKPKQGWMYRVVCPMCESNNFIPEAAAGREVKCANSECMVPVFTAPEPEKEVVPEPEKPKGLPGWVVGLASVVVVVALGAATYIYVLAPKPKPSGPVDYASNTPTPLNNTPNAANDVNPLDNIAKSGVSGQFDGLSLADVQSKALTQIQYASRSQSSARGRSFGTQIHALASLKLGDTETMEAKVKSLEENSGSLKFMAILPLAEYAIWQFQAGDLPGAKATVERAEQYTGSIPNNGRDASTARMALATACILTGKSENAWQILKAKPDTSADGEIAARLMLADALKTSDLNKTFDLFPILSLRNPQLSVAAVRAAQIGDSADVLLWATAETDQELQADALIGWAIGQMSAPSPTFPTEMTLVQEMQSLTAWQQARVCSTIAIAAKSFKNANADQYVAKAKQIASSAEAPEALKVPGTVEIYNRSAPLWNPTALQAAECYAMLAVADQSNAAEHLKTMASAFSAVALSNTEAKRLDEEASSKRGAISATLKSQLDLPNNDAVLRAYRQYARNVNSYVDASNERLRWEQIVLRKVLESELTKPLAESLDQTEAKLAVLNGSLGQFLIDDLKRQKFTDLANSLTAKANLSQGTKQTERWHLWKVIRGMVEAGQFDQAKRILKSSELSEDAVDWVTLRAVGTALNSKADAKEWAFGTVHPLAREQALRLVSQASIRNSTYPQMLEKLSLETLSSAELASAYYGLIEGIAMSKPQSPE